MDAELTVPTTWRDGYFEVERVHRADGTFRLVFTICSRSIGGQQDFTAGFIVPPEALTLALSGLHGQPCEVRVSDVEMVAEGDDE